MGFTFVFYIGRIWYDLVGFTVVFYVGRFWHDSVGFTFRFDAFGMIQPDSYLAGIHLALFSGIHIWV